MSSKNTLRLLNEGLDDDGFLRMGRGDRSSALVDTALGDVHLGYDGTSLNLAPSSGMWSNCPFIQYGDGFLDAFEVYDDFIDFDLGDLTGRWTLDNTGGTAVLGAAHDASTPGLGGFITHLHLAAPVQLPLAPPTHS